MLNDDRATHVGRAESANPFRRRRDMVKALRWLAICAVLLPFLALGGKPFRFAWLSDTHIGTHTAAEDLRASVDDINSMTDVDFVLISGDVTEYGSWQQLTNAKAILDQLKVRYRILPGNHDTKWSESGTTDFTHLWKADSFSFEHEGYQFIGLHQGPLMRMGDGHWAPQDVRWLERTLEKTSRDQPIIFVTHYPLDDGIANWYVVLDLLKKHNTQAVLCGHGHSNRELSFEGVPGIMGRSNLRAKEQIGGYNLVDVRSGEIVFSERTPGKLTREPWHSVKLERRDYSTSPAAPRPDFSVNKKYTSIRPRWKQNLDYTICSTPAIWEERAILGDASGHVSAYGVLGGDRKWRFKTGGPVYATAAVSGRFAIVPSTDGTIYALKTDWGKVAWRFKTRRPIVACPLATEDAVYIGSSEGKFRCLDAKTGKLRWEFDGVDGFIETRPLLVDGRVLFGAWDGHLYALDAATGQLQWKWKGDRPGTLLSPAACWPVAANGNVFIVAPDRQTTAISLNTGKQVWRTDKFVVRESIGISEDSKRIYLKTLNDYFYALDASSPEAKPVWERHSADLHYDINPAMLVEKEGTLFYGSMIGMLFALDAATGEVKWQHKVGNALLNTVVPFTAGAVLITDLDGTLALIENTGK